MTLFPDFGEYRKLRKFAQKLEINETYWPEN